jgi:hypothetical protein
MDTRLCISCHQTLPIEQFEIDVRSQSPLKTCSACKGSTRRKTRSMTYASYLSNLVSKSKHDSRRRGIDGFAITAAHLIDLWNRQEGRCAVSGVILTHHADGSGHKDFNASIDRIDSQQGYSPNNVQLVTYRVNLLKQSLSTDMLYWWVKTIYQHSCD